MSCPSEKFKKWRNRLVGDAATASQTGLLRLLCMVIGQPPRHQPLPVLPAILPYPPVHHPFNGWFSDPHDRTTYPVRQHLAPFDPTRSSPPHELRANPYADSKTK